MKTFNIFEGRVSRLVIILAVVIFLLSIIPTFSYAADGLTDTFTGQLVPCGAEGSDDMCGYCDLFTLGQNAINFMVYLAVILAVLLFVYAGFTFMTSVGNAGKVSHAKGLFMKAFIGLIIVLASWLIVDLVMKSFFDETAFGPWNPICNQDDLDASVGAGSTSTGGGSATGLPLVCSSCVAIDSSIPTKSGIGGYIHTTLNSDLKNFTSGYSALGVGWQVTEAYPPEVIHIAACHNNGQCIDANFTSAATAGNITTFINTAALSGLRAVYEVKTDIERDALRASTGLPDSSIITVPEIDAPHFSVYLD